MPPLAARDARMQSDEPLGGDLAFQDRRPVRIQNQEPVFCPVYLYIGRTAFGLNSVDYFGLEPPSDALSNDNCSGQSDERCGCLAVWRSCLGSGSRRWSGPERSKRAVLLADRVTEAY